MSPLLLKKENHPALETAFTAQNMNISQECLENRELVSLSKRRASAVTSMRTFRFFIHAQRMVSDCVSSFMLKH
jgi:hypothetical protein